MNGSIVIFMLSMLGFSSGVMRASSPLLSDVASYTKLAVIGTGSTLAISVVGVCSGWDGLVTREMLSIPALWMGWTALRIAMPPSG